MTDSNDLEISELRSRIARLDDALCQAVIDAAEWARKAGEAQGKLEISEAAGILDGWMRDCKRLEADNARLREALGEIWEWIGNWSPDFIWDDEWPATEAKARAALQETSHETV